MEKQINDIKRHSQELEDDRPGQLGGPVRDGGDGSWREASEEAGRPPEGQDRPKLKGERRTEAIVPSHGLGRGVGRAGRSEGHIQINELSAELFRPLVTEPAQEGPASNRGQDADRDQDGKALRKRQRVQRDYLKHNLEYVNDLINRGDGQSNDEFENLAITTQSERGEPGAQTASRARGSQSAVKKEREADKKEAASRAAKGGGDGGSEGSSSPGSGTDDRQPGEPVSDSDEDATERPDRVDEGGPEQTQAKRALDFEAAKAFAGVSGGSGFAAAVDGPWRALAELDSLPLIKSGYSLEADMKFGWKPTVKGKVLPIPLVFDTEDDFFDLDHYPEGNAARKKYPVIFQGWRPADSLKMYKRLLGNTSQYEASDFPFKVPSDLPPSVQKLLDQQMQERILGGARPTAGERGPGGEQSRGKFEGMNPDFQAQYDRAEVLRFDCGFESGNLDRVIMVSPTEYDLYMRPDTNTRGHHQWFFFKAISGGSLGPVRFNILNFTKQRSLYEYGMKVCVCSVKEKENELARRRERGQPESPLDTDAAGWKRGGQDIKYELSKLNKIIQRHHEGPPDPTRPKTQIPAEAQHGGPTFYQLSFTYDFSYIEGDETYFAYTFPYTFTRLSRFLRELKADPEVMKCTSDCTPLCQSLAGIDVPYLVVTSGVHEEGHGLIQESMDAPADLPAQRTKKTVVLLGRVHPGEANSSYMMEGFIRFITGPDTVAQELRKRLIFKIVPCTNPDGVIAGNYRVSLSGNDLNRRYQSPHPKLHPIVCAVKKLIKDEKPDLYTTEENQILAFIDMHGHSRKKNVFMYGPQFPIHDGRYLKMRVIPKLMSEQTEMFRFFSCKFRIQKSKEKTARVVLWREFNIMNCFTLEASFQGYFDGERQTRDFAHHHFFQLGEMLASTLFEFVLMREEDEALARARREEAKRSKQRAKAAQVRKRPEGASQQNVHSAAKGLLSPSASSEAVAGAGLDDLQPNQSSQKAKMQRIRKRLINSQQKNKPQQPAHHAQTASFTSKSVSGQKRKFKLTKRFKDDLPPPVPKKKANPNQPPEETEDGGVEETAADGERRGEAAGLDELTEDGQPDLLADDSDDDASEGCEKEGPKSTGAATFMAKFRLKRRTLKDLCHQIKTEEEDAKDAPKENIQEINSSDAGEDGAGGANAEDAHYRSDDDLNERFLQEIQGKILGVLKCEAAPPAIESRPVPAPAQPRDTSTRKAQKQVKQPSQSNLLQEKRPAQQSDKKLLQQTSVKKYDTASKRPGGQTLPQQPGLPGPGPEKVGNTPGKLQKRNPLRAAEVHRDRLRPHQKLNQSHNTAAAGHVGGNQGVLLPMQSNNFNERIMTQPYNKYRKAMFGGTSGGYHLQSLSTNAHQLYHRQFMHQQSQKQQVVRPSHKPQDEKAQAFSFYNFQARSNKGQMPLVSGVPNTEGPNLSRLRGAQDLGRGRNDLRGNHGRIGMLDDQVLPLDQPDQNLQQVQGERPRWDPGLDVNTQMEEAISWDQQRQPLSAGLACSRNAQSQGQSHSSIQLLDQHAAQRHQDPSAPTQPAYGRPPHTMQPLYSTPQQPHPAKLERQAGDLRAGRPRQLPIAQRSAQLSQGQLHAAGAAGSDGKLVGGLQRPSRRLVPAGEAYQPQRASCTCQANAASIQHPASQAPRSTLEGFDKIPHHVSGILSGSGLCQDPPGREFAGLAGPGLRPSEASSALALGAPTNPGLCGREEHMQGLMVALPGSRPGHAGSLEPGPNHPPATADGERVRGLGREPVLMISGQPQGLGMRSSTSFTAQTQAQAHALESLGQPTPCLLAVSSSVGAATAPDAAAQRCQDATPPGQPEAMRGSAATQADAVANQQLNETSSKAYADRTWTDPAQEERELSLSGSQSRSGLLYPPSGVTGFGVLPTATAKVASRGPKLCQGPLSRAILVRGFAARVEGPRSQASGQGARRGPSGRRDLSDAHGPGADYAYPAPTDTISRESKGRSAAAHLADPGTQDPRLGHHRHIDLKDAGLGSSKASLLGSRQPLLGEAASSSSGVGRVLAAGRTGTSGIRHYKEEPRQPQALVIQPPSSAEKSSLVGLPAQQFLPPAVVDGYAFKPHYQHCLQQSSHESKPAQGGLTVDVHRLSAPNSRPHQGVPPSVQQARVPSDPANMCSRQQVDDPYQTGAAVGDKANRARASSEFTAIPQGSRRANEVTETIRKQQNVYDQRHRRLAEGAGRHRDGQGPQSEEVVIVGRKQPRPGPKDRTDAKYGSRPSRGAGQGQLRH